MDILPLSRSSTLRLVCLSWMAGLWIVWLFPTSPFLIGGTIVIAILLGTLPLKGRLPLRFIGLLCLVFLLAITRSVLVTDPTHDPTRVESHAGEHTILTGTVGQISSPDAISSRFVLDASEPYSGPVYVTSPTPQRITYGQVVSITGRVERPLDFAADFSWEQYLRGRGIRSVMRDPLIQPTSQYGKSRFVRGFDALRQKISDTITRMFPHRSGALLSGILMGSKASFSPSFLTDLQTTGLTHIIALSGFNITILIAFVAGILLRRAGRYARFACSVAAIVAFILLVGPSASVIRAAAMGIITLLALTVGRRADPLNMLLLAVVMMTAYQPSWLFVDLGFQLSFLATLGIVLFIPISQAFIPKKKATAIIVEGLCTTLAAQLMTFPILLWNFGTVSFIAPLTNILIVCTIPSIMLLGGLVITINVIPGLGLLAQALGFLTYLPLAYVDRTISFFAHVPLASLHITWWNGYWTMTSYALIAGAYLALRRKLQMDNTAIH